MNIMELGAIGELVGGAAVLATLLYLALQVRQGTRVARSQIHQESSRMSSELLIHTDRVVLDLVAKASHEPERLSESDWRVLRVQLVSVTNYYETLYYAWERGEVDADLWESRRFRVVSFIEPQKALWQQVKMGFGKRFRDFVDDVISEPAPGWLLLEPPRS